MPDLEAHRTRLAAALGLSSERCRPLLDDLVARYNAPDRHYHTLDHLCAVLDTIQAIAGPTPGIPLLAAAWFHDAVYDPQAVDNEERSAALARDRLKPVEAAGSVLGEIERLILLTKTHRCPPDDRDGLVLLDADLSVLGSAEADYMRTRRPSGASTSGSRTRPTAEIE
jgi:predicted metal-dependent HD superfamily phosphohydrolase